MGSSAYFSVLAFVCLVLFLDLRKIHWIVLAIVPVTVSVLITFGLLCWMDVGFSVAVCCGTSSAWIGCRRRITCGSSYDGGTRAFPAHRRRYLFQGDYDDHLDNMFQFLCSWCRITQEWNPWLGRCLSACQYALWHLRHYSCSCCPAQNSLAPTEIT